MRQMTLEQWRRRYCLSRRELAKRADVSAVTVWRIEKAKHVPIMSTRRALAEALGKVEPRAIAWPLQRAA